MFAVSSTSRSTTIKPATSYADRAAIRRQASLSRQSALAAATENTPAGDSFYDEALCASGSFDVIDVGTVNDSATNGMKTLPTLRAPAKTRLTPVHIDTVRNTDGMQTPWDNRTYDVVYDRVVLGIIDAPISKLPAPTRDEVRELSATDITTVFQSVMREKSTGSRNAKSKSQRRASLEGRRSLADDSVRML
jgi:hypothetical protein